MDSWYSFVARSAPITLALPTIQQVHLGFANVVGAAGAWKLSPVTCLRS